jgi:hypothetical protein
MEPNQIWIIYCPVTVSPSYWYTSTFSSWEDLEDENSSENKILSLVPTEGVVLTKTTWLGKNWKRSHQCISCNRNENIQHLFLDCPFAKTIWRIVFLLLIWTNLDLLAICLVHGWTTERTLMSPRGGVNRRDDQFKLFLPKHLSWQCSTGQTGGDDWSDRSSTGLHRWHRSDRCASPVRPV